MVSSAFKAISVGLSHCLIGRSVFAHTWRVVLALAHGFWFTVVATSLAWQIAGLFINFAESILTVVQKGQPLVCLDMEQVVNCQLVICFVV